MQGQIINELEVSVIVTSRNEAKYIGACLESIKKQTFPKSRTEIIVVDNASSDKTKEIAARFTDKVFDFGPERSSQRNFGIRQAGGEFILYLDADMVLSESVIEECVRKSRDFGYVGLYIPEKISGGTFWQRVRDFERGFYNATCIDAVRFFKREAFLRIGGFDEALTGPEDWDFDRRIKGLGRRGIIESLLYHQEDDFNLRGYLNKKSYYARSFDRYLQKWGRQDPLINKQLGPGYRLFGVFLENGKWKRLLRHPLYSLGMYILRLCVGIGFLSGAKAKTGVNKKGVLIVSPFFRPNVGGVETHLDDLTKYLVKQGCNVYVITYQPLTVKARAERIERRPNLEVRRISWPGNDLFHRLESYPALEILYITPRLLWSTLWFLFFNSGKIQAIHAHGLNAALVARITNIFFRKKTTLSIHAIYNFKARPLAAKFISWIAAGLDTVMPLAIRSKKDLASCGIPEEKLKIYTQWVDQGLFTPREKFEARKSLGLEGAFFALFVGRLMEKKGCLVLLEAAKSLPQIKFVFVGDGPQIHALMEAKEKLKNIYVAGRKNQQEAALYYSAADVVVIPSQYEEGFARVVLEALSSARPIIAANKGCLPEMVTEDVAILVEPTVKNIIEALDGLSKDPERLKFLSSNARAYALKHFSESNAREIIETYGLN